MLRDLIIVLTDQGNPKCTHSTNIRYANTTITLYKWDNVYGCDNAVIVHDNAVKFMFT